ncbi:MAG TPA: hypothetical protein H9794_09855 [Candidatus Mediterraneibacter merdigallinarum]|nr:hypothetical protein [Candidatus Mediterraneibacter merdigallinarum]
MKTARKFICVLLAALLSALLLSSCGASGYVGTWHCEAGDADFQMELEKDGQVFFYQTLNDFVYTGTWDETEGYVTGVTLEERTGIDEDNALFCRIW